MKNQHNDWKKQVLYFYARTTGWIVVPALVAVFLHQYLNGGQLFVILGLGFIITIFGIWREIKQYQKDLDKK